MAPTSDERRVVAARLRAEVSEEECIDYAVCRIINDVLGVNGVWGAKAARILAELIDPMCHIKVLPELVAMQLYMCGRCGAMITGYSDATTFYAPRFCPNCGARVTDVGER